MLPPHEMQGYTPAPHLDTRPAFAPLEALLAEAVHALPPDAWELPTRCAAWRARDVLAHLTDTAQRRLGAEAAPAPTAASAQAPLTAGELLQLINRLNAEGVAARREMPLADLKAEALAASARLAAWAGAVQDLQAPARYPVSWAGQAASPLWLDLAREYMERWLHQMHIREAAGLAPELLLAPGFYELFVDAAAWALPLVYKKIDAAEGSVVALRAATPQGLGWARKLVRAGGGWHLALQGPPATALAELDGPRLWQLVAGQWPQALEEGLFARTYGEPALLAPLEHWRAFVV